MQPAINVSRAAYNFHTLMELDGAMTLLTRWLRLICRVGHPNPGSRWEKRLGHAQTQLRMLTRQPIQPTPAVVLQYIGLKMKTQHRSITYLLHGPSWL